VNHVAEKKDSGSHDKPHLQEDSIVARHGSGAAPALEGVTSYTGLLARSTKPGKWLLYPSLDMSVSHEIDEDDIVHSERLAAEKSPFGSLGGSRIFVKKGAEVTTTRTVSQTHEAGDDFDLDIRLGASQPHKLCPPNDETNTSCITCGKQTCDTCATRCVTQCGTCNTCATQCNQHTCAGTCNTCATQCNQATCHTCQTQCNQHTCDGTCVTCATCAAQRCIAHTAVCETRFC
jgi:hypothetical protein